MAADAAQFHWYKLCNSLEESDTQTSGLSLIARLQAIQQSLQGTEYQKFIAASPEKSRELLRRLNDVLAECRIFSHCYDRPFTSRNMWRFNLVTKLLFLRKRRQKLKEIEDEMKSLRQQGMESSPAPSLLSAPADASATAIRFEEMVEEAENVLLGRKGEDSWRRFNAYGITGLAGTGKTALAREVFSRQEILREFAVRIWVSLFDPAGSGNNVGEDIAINITKYLLDELDYDVDEELRGTDDADHDMVDLLKELKKRLSEAGKHLIVFDHVCQESEWYESLASSLGGHGATIVTSKREDLVKRIVGQRSFITCLDQEDESEGRIFMATMANKIENMLLGRSEKFIAYGIIGMSGAGKTALARQVFNSKRVRQEFPVRIWVCLSDMDAADIEQDHGTDIGAKIVKYMLEQLDFDADQEMRGTDTNDTVLLLAALKKMLCKQKYLIVLDGVWQESDWYQDLQGLTHRPDRLSHGLPKASDGSEGGAVIVTGRVEDHVKGMVGDHSPLTCIDPDRDAVKNKCWEIFERVFQMQGHGAQLSENIKRDIQYKIQGLPLAAKTLGTIIPAQIRDMSSIKSQT